MVATSASRRTARRPRDRDRRPATRPRARAAAPTRPPRISSGKDEPQDPEAEAAAQSPSREVALMAVLVWAMMGIAIWHFTVFLPDHFWGGIVGAFLVALIGVGRSSASCSPASPSPANDDITLLTALEGIPGRAARDSPPATASASARGTSPLHRLDRFRRPRRLRCSGGRGPVRHRPCAARPAADGLEERAGRPRRRGAGAACAAGWRTRRRRDVPRGGRGGTTRRRSRASTTPTALILGHVARGSAIVVHGDYDCDGVSSTAILVRTLRDLGAAVSWFLPSRSRTATASRERDRAPARRTRARRC